jgi:hypothetical protein
MANRTAAVACVLAGGTLSAAALTSSTASIEHAFLGNRTGVLEWGPALFRALLLFHGASLAIVGLVLARRPGPRERTEDVPAPSQPLWIAIGLLGMALVLRLWQLNTDLWLDEVLTLTDFLRLPMREIVTTFPSQNQHMLYSLLGRLSVATLGESAAAARVPAVLFGVAAIWALFLLGRRVTNSREALLACGLMTFSYHHVWFSQNARGYTGLLFFSTLCTWLWLEALEHGRSRQWVAYGLSIWLGLWIHMTMIFVVASHGLVYLVLLALSAASKRTDRERLSDGFAWKAPLSWLFAATLTLQGYALSLPEFFRSALHEESLESEWINPLWVLQESVRRLADGGLASLVVAGGLVTVGAALFSLFSRSWRTAAVLVVPGVLGGVTMLALGHNLWPRFFFFCMGFALLLVVRGVMAVPQWIVSRLPRAVPRRLTDQLGAAACLLVIGLSAATLPRAYLPKQDFSGARRYVDAHKQPGDATVAVGLAGLAYARYYAPEWPDVEHRADLESIKRDHQGVWLVYTLPVHVKAWLPEMWDLIESDYEVVQVFPGTLGGGDVTVCRWRGRRS